MSIPSPEQVLAAARAANWTCELCREEIRLDDGWVSMMPGLEPCHLACAMADPRVRSVDIERETGSL